MMNNLKSIQDLIEVTNCRFVSLKYLGEKGEIQQIDVPANLILENSEYIIADLDIDLRDSKAFMDPFRSMPTITVFCHKRSIRNLAREKLYELSGSTTHYVDFRASISFWIINNELQKNDFSPMQADPFDLYANLRSEIMSIADEIKIDILSHHYGSSSGESVINISAQNMLKLADDILVTKFIISNCAASYNFMSFFTTPDHKNNLHVSYRDINTNRQVQYEILAHNYAELYELIVTCFRFHQ
ncbi:MAG: hypothetical protein H6909_05110 [Rickettsiaceae bacterium]|nr:hypothetical protein [Rickettsiaceae bacterium]